MTTESNLLPPNSTAMERALSNVMARVGAVPVPIRELWDPMTCPAHLLPWLAWALSIDRWRVDWSEDTKRFEVARAIEQQRLKGTPESIEALLHSYDPLIRLVEWFERQPAGQPHTFQVIIPLDGSDAPRSTAEFAEELVRDIARIKPARSHYELLLEIAVDATLFLAGAGYAMLFQRSEMIAETPDNADILVTEDGFALVTEDGELLEVG